MALLNDPADQFWAKAQGGHSLPEYKDCTPCAEAKHQVLLAFLSSSLVTTDQGLWRAADICIGDRLLTRDQGFQPVMVKRSMTFSREDLKRFPHMRPCLAPAAMAPAHRASESVWMPPGQRVYFRSRSAKGLVCLSDLAELAGEDHRSDQHVTYVLLQLARHDLVLADGLWVECVWPGGAPWVRGRDQAPARPMYKAPVAHPLIAAE